MKPETADTTQELTDTPKTPQQAERQKGPMPMAGIALAIGLILACALFFLPAFFGKH